MLTTLINYAGKIMVDIGGGCCWVLAFEPKKKHARLFLIWYDLQFSYPIIILKFHETSGFDLN